MLLIFLHRSCGIANMLYSIYIGDGQMLTGSAGSAEHSDGDGGIGRLTIPFRIVKMDGVLLTDYHKDTCDLNSLSLSIYLT